MGAEPLIEPDESIVNKALSKNYVIIPLRNSSPIAWERF